MGYPLLYARKFELQNAMSNIEMMMLQISQARQSIVDQVNELTIQRNNLSNTSGSIWTEMASYASFFSDDPEAQQEMTKMATMGQMMESMGGNSVENQARAIDKYIAELKAAEQQYELKQKALETTYSQMSTEYETVSSAASKSASESAPQFG